MSQHLRVNPVRCTGHGACAELLPEHIRLDEWGYPLVAEDPLTPRTARHARRAVSECPALALLIVDRVIVDRVIVDRDRA